MNKYYNFISLCILIILLFFSYLIYNNKIKHNLYSRIIEKFNTCSNKNIKSSCPQTAAEGACSSISGYVPNICEQCDTEESHRNCIMASCENGWGNSKENYNKLVKIATCSGFSFENNGNNCNTYSRISYDRWSQIVTDRLLQTDIRLMTVQ